MKPGGGRAKGFGYERETAIFFRELDPLTRRNLEYQEGSVDLTFPSGKVRLAVQCKCQKRPDAFNALREAEAGKKDARDIPIAFVKKSSMGKEPEEMVCMRKKEWLLMAKKYFGVDDASEVLPGL